jgi:hypothetical protein
MESQTSLNPGDLLCQTQGDFHQWSCLFNATGAGGALKPEKCFWYLLGYRCKDKEWSYAEMAPHELFIANPVGSRSAIMEEDVTVSKKTLGIHNSPATFLSSAQNFPGLLTGQYLLLNYFYIIYTGISMLNLDSRSS